MASSSSSTKGICVSLMTEPDIPGAITAIQQAFSEDPYNLWVYNDRSKLDLTRNRVSLGIRCRWGMRNALFYVAKDLSAEDKDKVLGVAMWMPPKHAGVKESWDEWFEGWKLWFKQVGMNCWYGRGGLNVKRYFIWKQKQSEAQSQIWTDPEGYYFLNIVVVVPEMQGQGIGRRLTKEITNKADREGRRCYLESSRDLPNTKIYEAMGFRYVKQMDCNDDGDVCKLYCMVREPQKADGLHVQMGEIDQID